ncbi:DNA alkylation repair protein [Actinokineospora sp. HUAS TT18]|uniref:DNA alkylation repair protein n=1 Tax=Actinokineospora sp. HUAS TT18 TaxID=3447451 RepID=UPI003F51E5E6
MDLVTAVRAGLKAAANPAKAPEMQRYMKSDMPFFGVAKPERAALVKALFAEHPIADRQTWVDTMAALWREATHREQRYVALDLAAHKPYQRWQDADLLPLYEEFIVTGAWWDFVDEVANRRIGPLLPAVTADMLAWSTDEDRWKRRASIICQLAAKHATDTDLLTEAIEANEADPDFFLRKGIGWALREYAKTEPGWVRHFVDTHPGLSPLSRREALKHL